MDIKKTEKEKKNIIRYGNIGGISNANNKFIDLIG